MMMARQQLIGVAGTLVSRARAIAGCTPRSRPLYVGARRKKAMAGGNSVRVVVAAFACNGLIAVSKFVATGSTGSPAMLSEALHSVADAGNQALLLLGLNRAGRPADAQHPFGYGKELYFWSFVVAVILFSMGAGVLA